MCNSPMQCSCSPASNQSHSCTCCLRLLQGTAAPVMKPDGIDFSFLCSHAVCTLTVVVWQVLGATALAQGLLNNVSLHTLNLAWNGLEDAGCTAISQTLHQNMGLQVGSSSSTLASHVTAMCQHTLNCFRVVVCPLCGSSCRLSVHAWGCLLAYALPAHDKRNATCTWTWSPHLMPHKQR